MDEIKRRDRAVFRNECLNFGRLVWQVPVLLIIYTVFRVNPLIGSVAFFFHISAFLLYCFGESVKKRFIHESLRRVWKEVDDRANRFDVAAQKLKTQHNLPEMAKTVARLRESLYTALRKADLVLHEIMSSEKSVHSNMISTPPPLLHGQGARDSIASELYQIADKNVAEYRQLYSAVMASVQRTEAQAAVYITTLDTMRVKMLGYRLSTKNPSLEKDDFVSQMGEAKSQLQAIDTALDEIEMDPFKLAQSTEFLSSAPPPIPEEAFQEIEKHL